MNLLNQGKWHQIRTGTPHIYFTYSLFFIKVTETQVYMSSVLFKYFCFKYSDIPNSDISGTNITCYLQKKVCTYTKQAYTGLRKFCVISNSHEQLYTSVLRSGQRLTTNMKWENLSLQFGYSYLDYDFRPLSSE